jgi:GTP pyrophosphokinase
METFDIERIKEKYRTLMNDCRAQIPEKDLSLVEIAMNHALTSLGLKQWENGEYIINHSISVARIAVLELGLSTDSLISCLLHNVFDQSDHPFSASEIKKEYRAGVSEILDGIIKINSLILKILHFKVKISED